MSVNRKVRIGLFWHSPNSGNLGVGALTVSNIAILREEAERFGLLPHFVIVCFRDPEPYYVAGPDIEVVALTARDLGRFRDTLSQIDCVFDIGAGDSWTDIYPFRRFAFLWLTKMMAHRRRVPLVFAPQTIGPFTKARYRIAAHAAMRKARAIVARDPVSADVARDIVPRAQVVEAIDVAFALPYRSLPKPSDGLINVGLNVSGLLFNGGYAANNSFGLEVDYASLTRKLIEALRARGDVRLHLFTHVVAPAMPADDDARVANMLASEFPGVVRVPDFADPSAAKSFVAGMDFVVSGRMHACIAAYSSGVPVVPVAYSRKFSGLFDGVLGYGHSVPVRGLSTEAAVTHILRSFDNRAALANEIAEGLKRVEQALERYRAVVRETLEICV